ncbi:MAG: hypothetical protein ACXU8N_16445 [Telluria sp.]
MISSVIAGAAFMMMGRDLTPLSAQLQTPIKKEGGAECTVVAIHGLANEAYL